MDLGSLYISLLILKGLTLQQAQTYAYCAQTKDLAACYDSISSQYDLQDNILLIQRLACFIVSSCWTTNDALPFQLSVFLNPRAGNNSGEGPWLTCVTHHVTLPA